MTGGAGPARSLAAALAGALGLLSCAAPPASRGALEEPEEWIRLLPEGVDIGAPTHLVVRVVDDATGAPLPGARIATHDEYLTPMPGIWEPGWSGTADRDGWILVPVEDRGNWLYADADGYGPVGEMAIPEEFRLRKGEDIVVEVRDFLDRPIPGALVDYMLGCGHTPPVRLETTGPDGRAILRCIDREEGSAWIHAAGVLGNSDAYGGLDGLPEEDGVLVVRCDPAPVVAGVVLDAVGAPVPGIAVGTSDKHRGPWTRTDTAGRFRLFGAHPDAGLEVRNPEVDEGKVLTWFEAFPGASVTVRLPGEGEEPESEADSRDHPVRVRGRATFPFEASELLPLLAYLADDGLVVASAVLGTREGPLEEVLLLPPGPIVVVAGKPAGQVRRVSKRIEVPTDGPVDMPLVENPRWRPHLVREDGKGGTSDPVPIPWPGDLSILTPFGRERPAVAPEDESAIFVPAEGLFVVEYTEGDARVRRVFSSPPADDAGPLVLPAVAPDRWWTFQEPSPVGEVLPEAEFRALLPDGSSLPGCRVQVDRRREDGHLDRGWYDLDESGAARMTVHRGDRVTVYSPLEEVRAPMETVVDGPGPWTLRWPDTVVEVRVLDEEGRPADFAEVQAWDRSCSPGQDGVVEIRGFAPGPVRLWIGADERRSAEVRLVLREGERRRTVVVVLPEAPPPDGDEAR